MTEFVPTDCCYSLQFLTCLNFCEANVPLNSPERKHVLHPDLYLYDYITLFTTESPFVVGSAVQKAYVITMHTDIKLINR